MNRQEIVFLKQNRFYTFPHMVQLEITRRCPFHCKQCYKKQLQHKDMDFEKLQVLLKLLSEKGVGLITLNGGEPLLYPHIIPLLRLISTMALETNIFTSGYGLNNEMVDILSQSPTIHLYVSLNGSTKKINELSREGYDISIQAIQVLSNCNAEFGINWVARHDNVNDFSNMLHLCDQYHISFLSVTSNKLTGQDQVDSALSKEDLICLANQINFRKILSTYIYIESCFSTLSTLINANKNSFSAHCYAGVSNCNINCDFTFQPCTHLKYPEKYNSIEEYWMLSPILKKLRNIPAKELKPCNECIHNKVCSLCRAMYLEAYTDFESGVLCPQYQNDRCII